MRRRLSAKLTGLILALSGVVFVLAVLAGRTPNAVYAECSIDEGNNVSTHAGFFRDDAGFSDGYRAIKANIWNYNPHPVFFASTIWVMLHDSTKANYAQVGWVRWGWESAEYVFSETTTDSETVRKYYDAVQGEWVSTVSTQPPSSKEYKVTWVDNGGNHQIQNVYDGGTSQNLTVSWEPAGWQTAGETLNYEEVVGTDRGDHVPGDTSNKIQANDIRIYDGSWSDASGYGTMEGNNADTDTNNWSGVGFRIWDVRCAE